MADMMYFMNQNKKKEEVKKKERHEKSKLKDVNMAAPCFDKAVLNEDQPTGQRTDKSKSDNKNQNIGQSNQD